MTGFCDPFGSVEQHSPRGRQDIGNFTIPDALLLGFDDFLVLIDAQCGQLMPAPSVILSSVATAKLNASPIGLCASRLQTFGKWVAGTRGPKLPQSAARLRTVCLKGWRVPSHTRKLKAWYGSL